MSSNTEWEYIILTQNFDSHITSQEQQKLYLFQVDDSNQQE